MGDVVEIDLRELLKLLKFVKEKTQMGAKEFTIVEHPPYTLEVVAHDKYGEYIDRIRVRVYIPE